MSRQSLYLGRSGQMAVMAEFLARGYNVAIPEVDIGDDIFVVRDSDGDYARVQVKTALAVTTKQGYSTRYSLKFAQLKARTIPETWYVFANRLDGHWVSFLVLARQTLYDLHDIYNIGSLTKQGSLSLYCSYTGDSVLCSGQELLAYVNNWTDWPTIAHK